MPKAQVKGLQKEQSTSAKIQFDLSGTLKQCLNGNNFALHILDASINYFECNKFPRKSHVSNIVRGFISGANEKFSKDNTGVRMIRADNAPENIPTESK